MAMANESLEGEVTCSICLEFFTNPVTIECGHSYCLACISEYMKWEELVLLCPECRQSFQRRNLNPNKRLANIAEVLKQSKVSPRPESLCDEHKQSLQLFCKTDGAAVCAVCCTSTHHNLHDVVPIQEAVQTYKPLLLSSLAALKTHLEKVQKLQNDEEARRSECQRQVSREKQKILVEFQALQRFVREQQNLLLEQLEEKENKELMRIQRKVNEMEELQSSLRDMIAEMESKCQQQDAEFLKDAKILLSRVETSPLLCSRCHSGP
ncbi:E3 ubiquitin-protein ligase TRIM39-like isoform X2 [Ambystoma mexicanum]|uniref:E3 ubiquitin-protein ligase TRIM39-like isoform X2 n=1 Tax=Ambystoma mexicanum TaxID=8296 RepID=UPI0037E98AD2